MKKVEFAPGEFYHLYSRGIDKRLIFLENVDYFRFLLLLYVANDTRGIDLRNLISTIKNGGFPAIIRYVGERQLLVDIGVYCLMGNHFHLLVRERVEGGISQFMERLLKSYVMYFNYKYDRKGGLFEGPFQAKHANSDVYLKYLHAYIHLNPLKYFEPNWKEMGIQDLEGAEFFLKSYWNSSYLDFLGFERPEAEILNRAAFPQYFEDPYSFQDFIQEWLLCSHDEGLAI